MLAASVFPALTAGALPSPKATRAINIMNFIRAEEPREPMDLMQPVREQMALIKAQNFPATWLLQYDALVEGPFVDFLKAEMPASHEVGIWFEMNHKICEAAGVAWRGKPQWEWDYHVPIAYSIGYTPDERRKLADAAMATFKRVFGHYPRSIASWNLDAISVAHFADHYEIDAFGNCRDQLSTDGFTIWGTPIAAYYPNRNNAWSPALEQHNQISTPIFRLLGQDPVYYYDNVYPYPDTMEPVWPSGQSETFVDRFFDMIETAPTQAIAYAQLGQENSFGWPRMRDAYPMQMKKLAQVMKNKKLVVETMSSTGSRFKRSFHTTPTQAQVMLEDPYGKAESPERTVWYQSRFLRANLHFRGNSFYLRDLHVYSDRFPQIYLHDPVQKHGIEQRGLAVLDGYHWSDKMSGSSRSACNARGSFLLVGTDGTSTALQMAGAPVVRERGSSMRADVPLSKGGTLVVEFSERGLQFRLNGAPSGSRLALHLEWVIGQSSFQDVSAGKLHYRYRDFDYSIAVTNGVASKTSTGVSLTASTTRPLGLSMAQHS